MIHSRHRQLTLALPHAQSYRREDLIVGSHNEKALAFIDRWPDWPAHLVVLRGPRASGKSHLVEIWREASGARVAGGGRLSGLHADDILASGALAIEDADNVAPAALEILFHIVNRARLEDASLLLSCCRSPHIWAAGLADLASRLRAGVLIDITEPDDTVLHRILAKMFADRQLDISPDVLDYCLLRMERSLFTAQRLVRLIDEEALAAKRRVTKPLVAHVLQRLDALIPS